MVPFTGSSLAARAASNTLTFNGLPLGFIPDVGFDGGNIQTMYGINSILSGAGRAATYGFYDQVYKGQQYTGQNLLRHASDIYDSGAIFEATIMPIGGWDGFTQKDNSQALAVCRVLKRLTDAGVEVRLRFAHEVNWYVENGEYDRGDDDGVSGFKEAFGVVSQTCKSLSSSIKMWYCPNAADLTVYEKYLPDSFNSTVDIIGIDFYPETEEASTAKNFIETLQPFHDKYTSDTTKMMIAEAGSHVVNATIQQRLDWLTVITSDQVQQALPNLVSVTWYNALRLSDQLSYGTGSDFRIVDPGNDQFDNTALLNLFPDRNASTPITKTANLPASLKGLSNTATRTSTSGVLSLVAAGLLGTLAFII